MKRNFVRRLQNTFEQILLYGKAKPRRGRHRTLPLRVGEENKENVAIHMLISSERHTKERHRAIKLVIPEGWVGGKGRVMQRRATTHLVHLLYSFVFWGYINEPHIKNNIKIVTGKKSGIIFSLTSLSSHRIKVRWFNMCQMVLFIFWSKCILELMPCSGLRVPYSSFISTAVIKSSWLKAMWRRRGFISACSFHFQPITVGSQGRDSTQSQQQGETQACSPACCYSARFLQP